MKYLLPCLAVLTIITGCASPRDVTNARIRFAVGSNEVFSIEQPKDTQIGRAEYRRPDGSILILEDYQSTGNAAAIEAFKVQAQMQRDVTIRAMEMVGDAKDQVARSYGIPAGGEIKPGLAQTSPSTVYSIPEPPAGFKWTVGTNGIPSLAPKDDPSKSVSEIPVP